MLRSSGCWRPSWRWRNIRSPCLLERSRMAGRRDSIALVETCRSSWMSGRCRWEGCRRSRCARGGSSQGFRRQWSIWFPYDMSVVLADIEGGFLDCKVRLDLRSGNSSHRSMFLPVRTPCCYSRLHFAGYRRDRRREVSPCSTFLPCISSVIA